MMLMALVLLLLLLLLFQFFQMSLQDGRFLQCDDTLWLTRFGGCQIGRRYSSLS